MNDVAIPAKLMALIQGLFSFLCEHGCFPMQDQFLRLRLRRRIGERFPILRDLPLFRQESEGSM